MSGSPYEHKLRVRVNGLLVRDDALLLVKINAPTREEPLWMPPGGGLEFGETMEACLVREMEEETGLTVAVENLRYVSQFVEPPYHAVEFYFDCRETGGTRQLGSDPELQDGEQMLLELKFIPFEQFDHYNIAPPFIKDKFVQDYGHEFCGTQFVSSEG